MYVVADTHVQPWVTARPLVYLGDGISREQEPLDATMSHMCPGASTKYWSNHNRGPSLETVPKKIGFFFFVLCWQKTFITEEAEG